MALDLDRPTLTVEPDLAALFDGGDLRLSADAREQHLSWYPLLRGGPEGLSEGRFVRVMSRPAGGQIRGYLLHNGRAYLWLPDAIGDWPEMDAEVSRRLGVEVAP